ncbi:VOC family protein [Jannaschia sp. W003]|uniref:VOC family protein n=1 Tax=Jannaschia sp. W003 TaxID=2867012 RepID=UPI0021A527A5|nr:VOC family protein [Jannaschia sp. W003]UWQ20993.1 VOC family protein [Jannaschia sp. W003]
MRGAVHHIALTVSDLKRSDAAFHGPVLGWLGYDKVEENEAMALWYHPGVRTAVNLWQAAEGGDHDRRRPGFHHIAFEAPDRSEVDDLYDLLVAQRITVLDAPAEYPEYGPGYYAVYFADPDGMKWEFAHMPVIPD